MKRPTKAEEALKAQFNMIKGEIQGLEFTKNNCEIRISALSSLALKIKSEIDRLAEYRTIKKPKE